MQSKLWLLPNLSSPTQQKLLKVASSSLSELTLGGTGQPVVDSLWVFLIYWVGTLTLDERGSLIAGWLTLA